MFSMVKLRLIVSVRATIWVRVVSWLAVELDSIMVNRANSLSHDRM